MAWEISALSSILKGIGVSSTITSDLNEIAKARKIILPGVGHFDRAMEHLNRTGLRKLLDQKALQEKVPVLGICLGTQIMTQSSEEGRLPGLGWIQARTVRFSFPSGNGLKIPHMGWNLVTRSMPSPLTEGFEQDYRFYFVHSYHVKVDNERHSLLKTEYGYPFESAIQNENIFGVQFHPEKSHRFGMRLLENFARL